MIQEQVQKRLRMIVVGGVTLAFVLITILGFVAAFNIHGGNEVARLEQENARLQERLNNLEAEMEWFNDFDFILEYARDNFNLGLPGSSIWTR